MTAGPDWRAAPWTPEETRGSLREHPAAGFGDGAAARIVGHLRASEYPATLLPECKPYWTELLLLASSTKAADGKRTSYAHCEFCRERPQTDSPVALEGL
jgi:hypothetical protein